MIILYSFIILTSIALITSVAIVVVNKKLAVQEDPKIEKVLEYLAGANCGACGKGGCADFARALVSGGAKLAECSPTSMKNKEEIIKILGSGEVVAKPTIVVNACAGGVECTDKYDYQGYGDCQSVSLLAGGKKSCPVGCIGMGKCINSCAYHAVKIVKGAAIINQEKCAKCGSCILDCPKLIIKRLPENAVYYVACSSTERGKEVRSKCKNGCIACGVCAKICPEAAITINNNLPVFNYEKCVACGMCMEKCPTKCIKKVEKKAN